MTREEMEARFRKEMQQMIPDKEALWARIEDSLPEQTQTEQEAPKPRIRMTAIYRAMAGVACLMLVVAGASLIAPLRNAKTTDTTMKNNEAAAPRDAVQDNAADQADGGAYAEDDAAAEAYEEDEAAPAPAADAAPDRDDMRQEFGNVNGDVQFSAGASASPKADNAADDAADGGEDDGMLDYSDLAVPQDTPLYDSIAPDSLKGYRSGYSDPITILDETTVFAKVTIDHADQSEDLLYYYMDLDWARGSDYYADEVREEYERHGSLSITSGSDYYLEPGHTYLLPLFYGADGWMLTCDCIAPIEYTSDGMLLIPAEWSEIIGDGTTRVRCRVPWGSETRYLVKEDALDDLFMIWEDIHGE